MALDVWDQHNTAVSPNLDASDSNHDDLIEFRIKQVQILLDS